jgi:hypothetical protein
MGCGQIFGVIYMVKLRFLAGFGIDSLRIS